MQRIDILRTYPTIFGISEIFVGVDLAVASEHSKYIEETPFYVA